MKLLGILAVQILGLSFCAVQVDAFPQRPGATGAPKNKGGGSIVSPYVKDDSGGSGSYKAAYVADATLPKHTIYAPKSPPKDIKMPAIVWGEGACASQGTAFVNLLTEIASHGYVVIANGAPGRPGQPFGDGSTTAAELTKSLNWLSKGGDAGKYGQIDKNKIAAAGQSCGGIEALSVSNDPRIKLTGMFNSGLFSSTAETAQLKNLNHPIAYLLGGTGDIAYRNGERDYKLLPSRVPAIKFNLPGAGHGGTYGERQAGKFGKVAVALFDFVFKGDTKAKSLIFDKASPFLADGWQIEHKNWT